MTKTTKEYENRPGAGNWSKRICSLVCSLIQKQPPERYPVMSSKDALHIT